MTHRERRSDLDALRGFAVLYIVAFWHLGTYSAAFPPYITPATILLTACILGLFTFLSGYLLSKRYNFKDTRQVGAFYRRRFIRIYPLYFAALTGFLALEFMDTLTYTRSTLLLNTLLNIPVATLWFVSVIVILYVLTPLFVYRFSLARAVILAGVLWGVLAVVHGVTGKVDLRLPQYLVAFVAGIIVARFPDFEDWVRKPSVTGICLLALAVTFVPYAQTQDVLQVVVVDIAIMASIPSFLHLGKFLAKWIPQSILGFISYTSFVTYLLHRITFHLGVRLYEPTRLASSILYLGCVVLPATILVAYGIQKGYDRILDAIGLSNKRIVTDKQQLCAPQPPSSSR